MALFGRPISRLDELKKIVAKDPTSRQFLALSDEYRRAGKLREAAETLENGLRENPGYVTAYVALGRIHQLSQRFDDAIKAFQAALQTDRINLVAIRQLADCYLKKGEKVEAIKKLKLFRGLQPGDRDVEELIQQLEVELNAPKPKPAVRAETWPSINIPGSVVPAREVSPLPAPKISEAPAAVAAPAVSSISDLALLPTSLSSEGDTEFLQSLDFSTSGKDSERSGPASPTSVEPAESDALIGLPIDAARPSELDLEHSKSSPVTGPIAGPTRAPLPSAERFDLTYDGAFPGRSTPAASPPVLAPVDSEPRSSRRDAETAPLPPIAAMVREVENESALLEAEPELGEISELASEPIEEAVLPAPHSTESAPTDHAQPAITETLAELYRTQGYAAEARQTYQGLADAERDPDRAREFRDRAAQLPSRPKGDAASRLREWAIDLPAPRATRIEDLSHVLETLVATVPGIRAAALTDLEGLPLVAAGEEVSSSGMEALIAELTAFWKGVHRTREEVGAGLLSSLTLTATDGAAIVSSVSPDYSLILRVDRETSLGRIRYEASRAAGILRPALG